MLFLLLITSFSYSLDPFGIQFVTVCWDLFDYISNCYVFPGLFPLFTAKSQAPVQPQQ